MTPLLDFYTNVGTDRAGRTFDDVMQMTDAALDADHCWVQWVFPVKEPSTFKPDAPLPSDDEINLLWSDPVAQANLSRAFVRFLWYLGLHEEADGKISPTANFAERHKVVWSHFNHNFLRVTRFLASLRLMGQVARSAQVCKGLSELGRTSRIVVSGVTIRYWAATQIQYTLEAPDKTLVECLAEHGYSPVSEAADEAEAQHVIHGLACENLELRHSIGTRGQYTTHGYSPADETEAQQIIDSLAYENMELRYRLFRGPDAM